VSGGQGFTQADSSYNCQFWQSAAAQWGSGYYAMPYQNVLYCGGKVANDCTYSWSFSSEQLYTIDTKADDGKPGTGKIRTGALTPCSPGADPATAQYVLPSVTNCGVLLDLLGN
jgi:hypothetical protein